MDDDPMTSLKAKVREAYVRTLYAAQAGSLATPRHLAKLADLMLALAEASRAARAAKAAAVLEAAHAKPA